MIKADLDEALFRLEISSMFTPGITDSWELRPMVTHGDPLQAIHNYSRLFHVTI